MEAVFVLFCCGLSAAIVAKIKGSSFLVWFAVGFVLPGIGTIAAVLYRNERTAPRRECPECGATLPLQDQVCRRCGADLQFPAELDDGIAETRRSAAP